MNVNGVWKLEISGLHGWERLATVFLENGRYLSASADHYTIGRYVVDGKNFTAEATAVQHGNIVTVGTNMPAQTHHNEDRLHDADEA